MWWPQKAKEKTRRRGMFGLWKQRTKRWWLAQSIDMPKHKSNETRLKGVFFMKIQVPIWMNDA